MGSADATGGSRRLRPGAPGTRVTRLELFYDQPAGGLYMEPNGVVYRSSFLTAGHDGGRVVFTGTPADLVSYGETLTARHLREYVGTDTGSIGPGD